MTTNENAVIGFFAGACGLIIIAGIVIRWKCRPQRKECSRDCKCFFLYFVSCVFYQKNACKIKIIFKTIVNIVPKTTYL